MKVFGIVLCYLILGVSLLGVGGCGLRLEDPSLSVRLPLFMREGNVEVEHEVGHGVNWVNFVEEDGVGEWQIDGDVICQKILSGSK